MKLLFIIHNLANCGAERVLTIIANELANRGNQVYILTDPNHISYELDPRVTVLDAYQGIDIGKTMGPIGNGFRFLHLMLKQFFIVKNVLKDLKPDFTISFMGMCIVQLFPFRNKHKIIISDHSAMDRQLSRYNNFRRRKLPEWFYCQTVLTLADKEYLGKKRTNVVVVSDPLTFCIMTNEEFNEGFNKRKKLLACGSIDRYYIKGIDSIIRIFAIVSKKHPDWELDIAGGGSDEKLIKMKELANECGVASKVSFLGFSNDVEELMKTHSVLVHSPRSEGFGMVITEAMACGCPVISYNHSGPKEIINNGVDGYLIENGDMIGFAKTIEDVMTNDEKRFCIAQEALKSVRRFSVKNVVDRWESLFKGEMIN